MQSLVVVYDIVDNKTRRIVGDILEGFGKRVNRSVFEIQVKNAKIRTKLELALQAELNTKVDSLRIYTVCSNCMQSSTVLGKEADAFDKDAIYFFLRLLLKKICELFYSANFKHITLFMR